MPPAIIDPWGSTLPEDYTQIVAEFGLEQFDPALFPDATTAMRRGIVFAGRDLKIIADCIANKKPFYALTGIMPTADRVHFGNKLVVESLRYFQDHGAKTYILVADLEAMATRGVTLEEAQHRALDFHIPAYIALGLDPKNTTFYFQSENHEVSRLGYEFAKRITYNEFKAIYGSADPGRIMAAMTQVGDILFPQLEERMPGIIPVGIDQDPHIRLTRDIARRTASKYKFWAPSSLYNKYTPALDGGLKMSKSKPETCIELPDDPDKTCKRLKSALTGGRDTVEIQRKLGGEPEKCMIFELYKQHLLPDDKDLSKVYKDCRAGVLMCGPDKARSCELMSAYMKNFAKELEAARKKVDKLHFIGR